MRVLVSGGAGFIGHHLVRALLRDGHDVVVIDDLSSGQVPRLDDVVDQITFVQGSILDGAALDAAARGCEVILHEAAISSVARSVDDPRATDEANVGGTIEVMRAAARHRVRRVVLAGSAAVYGNPATLPCHESMLPAPLSPYGVSKLAAEHYTHALGALDGVETVVLRYFNVFGPGQNPESDYAGVVTRFISAALAGRQPVVNGDGLTSRDFVYVDNVVDANLRAMERGRPSRLTCNVAGGERQTLLDLLAAIGAAVGAPMEPAFGPPRSGDIRDSQADITVAREALGYKVVVPFESGVARTVGWYRDQSAVSPAPPDVSALP